MHYIITVSDEDAAWMDERIATGHRLFVTSSVPALHMSHPIGIRKAECNGANDGTCPKHPEVVMTECGKRADDYDSPNDRTVNGHYHYTNGHCDNEPSYAMGGPA